MADIIQTIKQDAVEVWDDVVKGAKWLGAEAEKVAALAEEIDPGIQVQLQALLKAGEAAAEVGAGIATGGMTNVVAAGFAEAESLVANAFQAATNGVPAAQPAGQALSAASVNTLQELSTALQAAIPVAVAKVMASLAASAASGAAQAKPAGT